jgi:hypothetical protein
MALRKEIRDATRAVDALVNCCITREDFSDEEFEAIKELTERIGGIILVCHIHGSAPPSEMTH